MPDTVRMIRSAEAHPESHEATVDADSVAEFEAMGWSVRDPLDHDGDGKKGGAPAGGNRRKKA